MNRSKLVSTTTSFILGATVGLGLALTLTPVEGKEARHWLRSQSLDLATSTRKRSQEAFARSREAATESWISIVTKLETKLRPEAVSEETSSQEETGKRD